MIAVALWGLTRSTPYTYESIVRYIYNQLPQHYVFLHTFFSSEPYENGRAGERADEGIKADYALLRPYQVEVENLDEVKRTIDFKAYYTHPDPWNSNYQTVDNFILAMYSKQKVTEMIRKSGIEFKTVIFIRPDVRFLSSIGPLMQLKRRDSWIIPSFHLYSGFNDRFCIASEDNYLQYGCVFPLLLPYSRSKELHSETFYATLARRHHIFVQYASLAFVFQRVRIDGTTDLRDLLLDKVKGHVSGQNTDAHNIHLNDRIFRNLPVGKTFTAHFRNRIPPV